MTPVPSKSAALRVTTVRSFARAVAAICLSSSRSGLGNSQTAPYLRCICVEGQYVLAKLLKHIRQPRLEQLRLRDVAAMANDFDAVAEFTYRNRCQIDGPFAAMTCLKKSTTPGLAFALFRASLMTLVSTKYIRRPPARSRALEVRVGTNLRHGRKNLCKTSPAGTRQRGSQDFPMFGLCAATMCAGPLLERPHQILVNSAHQQVSHLTLRYPPRNSDDIIDIILALA